MHSVDQYDALEKYLKAEDPTCCLASPLGQGSLAVMRTIYERFGLNSLDLFMSVIARRKQCPAPVAKVLPPAPMAEINKQ